MKQSRIGRLDEVEGVVLERRRQKRGERNAGVRRVQVDVAG